MNLTEKMALDCGVKVSRPYLDRYFLPIKNDNYIIIDTRCKNANGEYDYLFWGRVTSYLSNPTHGLLGSP